MYTVYILRSLKTNKYYVGSTNDLKRRFLEHNGGLSRYTRTDRTWEIFYSEQYEKLSSARKREKQIKSWKSRTAIEKLVK